MNSVRFSVVMGSGLVVVLALAAALGCSPTKTTEQNALTIIGKAAGIFGCRGCAKEPDLEEAAAELLATLEDADTDNDSRLSLQEAQAAIVGLTPEQFESLDLNDDGFVDTEELLVAIGQEPSEGEPVEGEGELVEGEGEPVEGEGEPVEGEGEPVEGEGEESTVDLTVIGQKIYVDTNGNMVYDSGVDAESDALGYAPGTLLFHVFEIMNAGDVDAPSFDLLWYVNDVFSHADAYGSLAPGIVAVAVVDHTVEQGQNAIAVEISCAEDIQVENNYGIMSYLGLNETASLNPNALIAGADKGDIYVIEDDGETILLHSPTAPAVGAVVLNSEVDGRIVRLTSVTLEGEDYRCETEPAGLAQVVDEGSLVFSVEIPEDHFKGLEGVTYDKGSVGVSLAGVSLSTPGGDAGFDLSLTDGSLSFTPAFDFALDYKLLQGLQYAKIAARGTIDMSYDWQATASVAGAYSVAVNLSEFYPALNIPPYPFTFVVPLPPPLPPLPVTGEVIFKIKAGYTRSFSNAMTVETGFDYHPWAQVGFEFANSGWRNLSRVDLTDFNLHPPVVSTAGAASVKVFVKPEVYIKLYAVGGPTFGPKPYGELGYESPPQTHECPYYFALGLDGEFGVEMSILDIDKLSFSYTADPFSIRRKEWPFGCGTPMLKVEPASQTVTGTAGNTSFAVSNIGGGTMPWNAVVTSGSDWLQIGSGGSGTDTGTINCTVLENTTTSQRSGVIQVAASGACDGSPRYVTVTQQVRNVLAPAITSFAINNGAVSSSSRSVTLNNVCTGSPTQFMASESPSFTGAVWQSYAASPYFTLSGGYGIKTVYFKVKNASGESGVVSDSINRTEPFQGEELTVTLPGDVPLTLVRIPAGTFMMGRYPGEQDSYSDEDPQHSVTLSQDFYLGKYELTQQQWLAVMGSWPGSAPSSTYGVGDSYPAYYVSWNDAQNFITALNTHITNTSQGPATFRLPTEAEWEYACRAGTTTRFYWGDDPNYTLIGDYAWYSGNNSPYGSKPVGGKLPNAFGLYDMSGNLWEWCQDRYGTYPSGSVTDPTGPTSGSYRVLRGGYWLNDGVHGCRSAYRCYYSSPGARYNIGGFRILRTP